MRAYIVSHGPSESATAVASALGIRRLRPASTSKYVPREGDVVINWGSNSDARATINPAPACALSTDKTAALGVMDSSGIPVPRHTTNYDQAVDWVLEGLPVYCRTLSRSSGGAGIVYAQTPNDVVRAPLYTASIPIRHEFRVHVMNGVCIDMQRKAAQEGRAVSSYVVRNHDNGWVFVRDSRSLERNREALAALASRAVASLGLHFGAVDVVMDTDRNLYVLEVNSAPGLTGATLDAYVQGFRALLQQPAPSAPSAPTPPTTTIAPPHMRPFWGVPLQEASEVMRATATNPTLQQIGEDLLRAYTSSRRRGGNNES